MVDHHAAQMDVRRCVDDPLFDADVNILGSIKLAQLAMEFGVRKFIHISSGGAVYGEPVYLPCDEEHPVRPLCPYGASKYTFELYLYMFKELYGLDYIVIRYPNVYGPRQDPNGEAGRGGDLHRADAGGQAGDDQRHGRAGARFRLRGRLRQGQPGDPGERRRAGCTTWATASAPRSTRSSTASERHHRLPAGGATRTCQGGRDLPHLPGRQPGEPELGWEPSVDLQEGLRRTVEYFKQAEVKK